MANINDWKPEVGMEVFIVPFDRRYPPTKGKIDKVARKYFYVNRRRFFINSKSEDNGDFLRGVNAIVQKPITNDIKNWRG